MKKIAFWLCLTGLVTLSLLPTTYLPAPVFSIWDKAQHALGFAVLTGLGHLAYPSRPWRIVGGMLLAGLGIELVQTVTGWRHGDGLDLLADILGIAVATGIWMLWGRRLIRHA